MNGREWLIKVARERLAQALADWHAAAVPTRGNFARIVDAQTALHLLLSEAK